MNKLTKFIKFIFGWPISIIALFFLWKIFLPNIPQILDRLTRVNLFVLFLSILSFQFYFLFRVILWQKILESKGHKISLKNTAWYWSLAEINRYIPGNVWSIVTRGLNFGKFGVGQSTLLLSWAREGILVLLGSSMVGLFGVVQLLVNIIPHSGFIPLIHWSVTIVVIALIILWGLKNKFYLLFLSFISFLFFGLGTYFALSSIFYLPFTEISSFVGLFSISYAIGYLSFITPMGLGVREFVISTGLISTIGKNISGFASVFARVFLIASEVIFLGITFICFRWSVSIVLGIKTKFEFLKRYKYEILLALSIIIYMIYFSSASLYRYTNFFAGRFDLGNMDQTVWNTFNGKVFMLTDPNGTNIMSRLGTHADFILILLAPFYVLWEDPRMLLLLQTLILSIGTLFIFLISKNILKNKSFSFVLSLAYLLNPSLEFSNLYDFHPVTLATTFFLGAWYFLVKKKYLWMTIFLILAGLTKEEAWIAVGLFGAYIAIKSRKSVIKIIFGILLTISSFAIFYLLVWKFIPLARGGQHFALSYYSDYGMTPGIILKNIILSPIKTLFLILKPGKLLYLLEIFFPLGFLPFISPLVLIFALPDFAGNLLSSNSLLSQIYYQYTAVITPFLFIATVYSVKFLTEKHRQISLHLISNILISCTLLSAYFYGPLPGAHRANIDMFVKQLKDRSIIDGFLKDIPSSFSVAATNNLGSHLSHRQNIYTVPIGIDKADIVAFLLNDRFAQPSLKAQKKIVDNLKHDKNYIEVFKENDFIVFEKRNLYTHKEPIIKGKLYPAAIEALAHRDFVGGKITIQKTIAANHKFKTVLFSYPSDGLTLYGKADIPSSGNYLPAVIINRGYIQSSVFKEETAYQNISNMFALNGFIAITPDYRNNGLSDRDISIAGILAYPIDELNLINSLYSFPSIDIHNLFLWGFSVGGHVTLTSLAAYDQNTNFIPTVKAASVWTPISDPYTGYVRFHQLFPNMNVPYQRVARTFGPFIKNPVAWESISPLYYVQDITTPIRIVDAFADKITPYQWSIELYDSLKYYNNNAQLALYNTDHNFTNTWKEVVDADIKYFRKFLSEK